MERTSAASTPTNPKEPKMEQPKFFPIYLTTESSQLVVAALRKLPHEQVHELVMDIVAQANKALAPPAAEPTYETDTPVDNGPDPLVDDEPK